MWPAGALPDDVGSPGLTGYTGETEERQKRITIKQLKDVVLT